MSTPAQEPRTTPEASPSPTPQPVTPDQSPGVKGIPLGFRTRSTSTATAPAPSPASALGADRQAPDDPLITNTPSASDPGAAADDVSPLKLKQKPLGEVIRGLVIAGSHLVAGVLARTEQERLEGVWIITDEDEAGAIADPLAKVANRHAGGALVNADANDLIAAGIAVAGYVISNGIKSFQYRRAALRMRRSGMAAPTEQENTA